MKRSDCRVHIFVCLRETAYKDIFVIVSSLYGYILVLLTTSTLFLHFSPVLPFTKAFGMSQQRELACSKRSPLIISARKCFRYKINDSLQYHLAKTFRLRGKNK